jgi:hypothetical protein
MLILKILFLKAIELFNYTYTLKKKTILLWLIR